MGPAVRDTCGGRVAVTAFVVDSHARTSTRAGHDPAAAPRTRPTSRRTHPPEVIDLTVRADYRLLLSAEEAAERLGIGRSLMYELISSGQVDSIRLGRLRRITPEALSACVAALRERGCDPGGPAA